MLLLMSLTQYYRINYKITFDSEEQRRTELRRFLNFYNTVRPHKGIDNLTPYEKPKVYFKQKDFTKAFLHIQKSISLLEKMNHPQLKDILELKRKIESNF